MYKNTITITWLAILTACGSSDKKQANKSPEGKRNIEILQDWTIIDSGVTTHLRDATQMGHHGLFVVGDKGTLLVSKDNGLTWSQRDLGIERNLYKIKWVNNIMYICGDDSILVSTDSGSTFTQIQGVQGSLRDIEFTSSNMDGGYFWAVGLDGLVLKAKTYVERIDELNPSQLTFEVVELAGATHLTGVSFSFDRGLIVGHEGYVAQTMDMGRSFERLDKAPNTVDLNTIDGETIGGDKIIIERRAVSGAPVGSFSWRANAGTEYPTILGLHCISTCLAVGFNADGGIIIELNDKNEVMSTLASSLKQPLNAIANIYNKSHIAVGNQGRILLRAAREP